MPKWELFEFECGQRISKYLCVISREELSVGRWWGLGFAKSFTETVWAMHSVPVAQKLFFEWLKPFVLGWRVGFGGGLFFDNEHLVQVCTSYINCVWARISYDCAEVFSPQKRKTQILESPRSQKAYLVSASGIYDHSFETNWANKTFFLPSSWKVLALAWVSNTHKLSERIY